MTERGDLDPLPRAFLDQLAGREEVLVSSRDQQGRGTVLMWFAVDRRGFLYLLTPAYTRKAQRWRDDPWLRLRVPGTQEMVEGEVREIGWEEAEAKAPLLTERFSLAGAVTKEALRWMLEDGSRRLLRAGLRPGRASAEPALVETVDRS